jgi:hypothetical protein
MVLAETRAQDRSPPPLDLHRDTAVLNSIVARGHDAQRVREGRVYGLTPM